MFNTFSTAELLPHYPLQFLSAGRFYLEQTCFCVEAAHFLGSAPCVRVLASRRFEGVRVVFSSIMSGSRPWDQCLCFVKSWGGNYSTTLHNNPYGLVPFVMQWKHQTTVFILCRTYLFLNVSCWLILNGRMKL